MHPCTNEPPNFSISIIGDAVLDNIESTKLCLVFPGIVVLVNKSSKLNYPGIHPIRRIPSAEASITLWLQMAVCLLFKADVGILKLLTTDMLSQNNSAGPSNGIPKHLNLYLRN